MKKFKYMVETLDKKFTFSSTDLMDDIERQLNKLGQLGWELTSIQGNTIFLKREIQE